MKMFFTALVSVLFMDCAWSSTQPDWTKTPGILCSSHDTNFSNYDYPEHIARCARNIGNDEKLQVATAYQVPQADWLQYEFDHLIPLCAGGSNSPQNLWPQPLDQAHIKDKLEFEICIAMKNGTMTQAQAVQKVHDWFTQSVFQQ